METLKNNKITIIALVVGLLAGRFALQPKAKTEYKTVEKVVQVIVERKTEEKKLKTKIVEHVNKDGSKDTVTEITDDSVVKTDTDSKTEASKVVTSSTSNRGVQLGLMAMEQIGNFKSTPEVALTGSFPVFGSVSITALVSSEKRLGVGIAVEF